MRRLTFGMMLFTAMIFGCQSVLAIPITRTFDFSGTYNPPYPAADPVMISFTVTFDPAGPDIFNAPIDPLDVTSNIPLDPTLVFTYLSVLDRLVFGANGATGSVASGTDDIDMLILDASARSPSLLLSSATSSLTPTQFFILREGSIDVSDPAPVPAPAPIALLLAGALAFFVYRLRCLRRAPQPSAASA